MTLPYTIPMDQVIVENADGYAPVRVVFDTGHVQSYRCYPADFTDIEKNKPCVVAWVNEGNEMPEVVPYVSPVVTLEQAQASKIVEIDAYTKVLITGGFTLGAQTFSSSEAAQLNIMATELLRLGGMLTYPVPWSVLSGEATSFADVAAWLSFYGAALTHIKNQKIAGVLLRAAVEACETVEEVYAIEDNADIRAALIAGL